MEYIIVAFRSRAYTVKFSNALTLNGISNQIVSTPKEAGVGCGLSVKVSKYNFIAVKRLVFASHQDSFAGFFLVSVYGNKKLVRTL